MNILSNSEGSDQTEYKYSSEETCSFTKSAEKSRAARYKNFMFNQHKTCINDAIHVLLMHHFLVMHAVSGTKTTMPLTVKRIEVNII